MRTRAILSTDREREAGMWYREIDWMEPMQAARRLAGLPLLSVLDSAMPHPELGRFSTVAADPFGVFRVEDGHALWNGQTIAGPPLAALRTCLARYPIDPEEELPPFQGGAIGAVAYEFGWMLDGGPTSRPEPTGRTMHFAFYDVVLAFDHHQKRCWVLASGWPEPGPADRPARADRRIQEFVAILARPARVEHAEAVALRWRADRDAVAHRAAVDKVKDYIGAGDIYQANIAQRFSADLPPGAVPLHLYERLREANPAPFAAYLDCGESAVLSSSPERLLRLRGRAVEARPIKGTALRPLDPIADAAAAQALLRSAKDRAENVMIVDLLRNDLSRVCEPHSVVVPQLCGLETYAGLHHLVSVVAGELREDLDGLDLIAAAFPGGSITGAPKLRAMEIIAEIEGRPRGVYCGAIGALGFDGDVDLNIAIRTLVLDRGVASFQVGGGITILSDAQSEYEETLAKARRIFEAFGRGSPADMDDWR